MKLPRLLRNVGVIGLSILSFASVARSQVSSAWIGGSAEWSDPSQWAPSAYYPNNGNGGNVFDVTINSGAATLSEPIAIQNLSFNGGTIVSDGYALTLAGSSSSWSGGTFAGTGVLMVASGATLNQGNTTYLDGGYTLANTGMANITGTLYSGNGNSSPNTITNSGTLNVSGTITENVAPLTLTNSGAINLSDGAQISGPNSTLTNTGTIQKNTGTGTASIWAGGSFGNSSGTISVSSGTLNLGFNGAIGGNYEADSGASLGFNQGTFTMGTASFKGDGSIALTGGTLDLNNATADYTGLTLAGGDITGTGTMQGTINWTGSTFSGTGIATINTTAALNQSGTTFLNGGFTLANAGTANIAGTLNSGAGDTTANAITNSGTLNLSGTIAENTAAFTLTNSSTLNLEGGARVSGPNSTLTNEATGTLNQSGTTYLDSGFTLANIGTANIAGTLYSGNGNSSPNTITNSGTLNVSGTITENVAPLTLTNSGAINLSDGAQISGPNSTLTNTGTIQKNTGTGTASIWAGGSFGNSSGTISVSSGTLNLGFNGAIGGNYEADSGASLGFNQGTFTMGTASFKGDGSIALTGGTLDLNNATADYTGLTLAGGDITGTGTMQGTINWTGSTFSGTGIATINTTAALNQSGTTFLNGGFTLANAGTANIAGTLNSGAGDTTANAITNSGTLNLSGTIAENTAAFTLTNSSTLNLEGGARVSGPNSTLTNEATGTLNQSGTTYLDSGFTLANIGTANIAGTLYSGNGNSSPNTITNSGTLNVSGTITENVAPLTLTNSGAINLSDGAQISGPNSTLTNTGTIQKNTGTGTASIWAGGSFGNSSGTISVSSGTLNLGFNGAIGGNYEADSGASLGFNQGTFTMGTASFKGDGSIALTGGTLDLNNATADYTGLTLAGGDVTGTGTMQGTINWTGSTFSGTGIATINTTAALNQSGTTFLNGGFTLANAGTANIAGTLNSGAGDTTANAITNSGTLNLSGTIAENTAAFTLTNSSTLNLEGGARVSGPNSTLTNEATGTLNQSGTTYLDSGFTLANIGTANIAGTLNSGAGNTTPNTISNSGTLDLFGAINESSAPFTLNNSGSLNVRDGTQILGPTSSLVNVGVVQKTIGFGEASIFVGGSLDNSAGSIYVSSGTLDLGFNGVITGRYATDPGGTLNFNQGSFTLGMHLFEGAGTIALTGGDFTLSGTPDLTNLNFFGGTISGDFSQPGDFTLAGSTLAGNATIGRNFNMSAGMLTGTVTQAGDINWSGGVISNATTTTVPAGQSLNQGNTTGLSGGSTLMNKGTANIFGTLFSGYNGDATPNTINNAGTLNLGGAILEGTPYYGTASWFAYPYGSAAFVLNNSGTMNLSEGSSISGNSSTLINTGLIQKNGGLGMAEIWVGGGFDNSSGTFAINSGTMNLGLNGEIAGIYQTNSGAELNFNQGNYTLGSHSFTGAGTFALTGGTLLLSGTPDLTNLNLWGGTITGNFSTPGDFNLAGSTLAGTVAIGGDFNWSGGGISNAATTAVSSGQSLNQSNTTWLSGGSTLTNNGTANIGGTLYSGYIGDATPNTINNAGTLNLAGSIVEHTPDFWWYYYPYGSAAFTLNNSGTINLLDGSSIYGPSSTLTNSGLIQSNGNTSIWVGGGYENSKGAVSVNSGMLSLGFNGTIGGNYQIGSGAILNFNQGNFFLGDHTFSGPGEVEFTGGWLELSNTPDLSGLILAGGRISGVFNTSGDFDLQGSTLVGNVTVGGNFNWWGGGIANGSTTDIASGHLLNQGNTTFISAGSTLAIEGMANVTGTLYSEGLPNTITNSGALNMLSGTIAENSAPFTLNNSGTINVSDWSNINGGSSTLINTGLIQEDGRCWQRKHLCGQFVR